MTEFWWNWWVSFGAAFCTFLAVMAALFMHWFKPRPRLVSKLIEKPIKTVELRSDTFQEAGSSYWWHVHVSNPRRRFSLATAPQMMIAEIKILRPDGTLINNWVGDLPVIANFGNEPVAIGRPAAYALCSVRKLRITEDRSQMQARPILTVHTTVAPAALKLSHTEPCRIWMRLEATSHEIDGKPIFVEIRWDGKWSDDESTIGSHVEVTEVDW
jgi:hypothetical protein